jgi:hypothetical protein
LLTSKILKDGLIEHFDYEVVSADVWSHFYSWYSADQSIPRFLRRDRFSGAKMALYLDLYPGKHSRLKISSRGWK